ncbi:MAG: type VI secretion system protein TssA [Desulfobacterales bacterium]|nr:type VI secretion system protein TssA [Desulfobacterales bacterium]
MDTTQRGEKMDLLSIGKNPISDDQPTGVNVRYEPEFEALQAEIDKLSVPSALGDFDWEKVSDLAATILSSKSKDLVVAGYLAVSQIYLKKSDGLSTGLQIMHDLLTQFWEDLFPPKKRMRGRQGAIEWWIEKTETALERIELRQVASETLTGIHKNLSAIDAILAEQFEDPPLLRPIQRIIETIASEETVEEKVETPQPQAIAQPKQAAAAAPQPEPSAPQVITSDGDVRNAINTLQQTLVKIAAFLQESDAGNPMAYRYRRMAAWSQISASPPAGDGQTQIPPPSPQITQPLIELRSNAKFDAFLIAAEQRFSQFIFWLDINRWVVESMASLGNAYQPAQEAVCQETAFLLYRLPGLEDLAFNDGTPFANSNTRRWLKSIKFGAGAVTLEAAMAPPVTPTATHAVEMSQAIEQAMNLAKQKKLVEAVQILHEESKKCHSKKEALHWRLALCQMLLDANRSEMAQPHLDLILNDIDRHQLTSWDPELALEGLKVVWMGFNHHTEEGSQNQAAAILNRIAELNPVVALQLTK